MEANQVSTDRWMGKNDVVDIHNEILLSHKKEGNNAICSNVNRPRDDHTKWSKSERHDITYIGNLKMMQMNLFIKQKQTHTYRKQTDHYQRGKGRGIN